MLCTCALRLTFRLVYLNSKQNWVTNLFFTVIKAHKTVFLFFLILSSNLFSMTRFSSAATWYRKENSLSRPDCCIMFVPPFRFIFLFGFCVVVEQLLDFGFHVVDFNVLRRWIQRIFHRCIHFSLKMVTLTLVRILVVMRVSHCLLSQLAVDFLMKSIIVIIVI